jgi:hypothetical protein
LFLVGFSPTDEAVNSTDFLTHPFVGFFGAEVFAEDEVGGEKSSSTATSSLAMDEHWELLGTVLVHELDKPVKLL